jgi:DedD protein
LNEALKQRLVGAAVLCAVVLIMWPLVMSPKREESFVIESEIPPKPALPPTVIVEPEPRRDVSPVGEYQDKISRGASVPAAKPREPQTAKTQAAKTPTVKTPAPALDKDGLPIAWIIQVGSFGNRDNASKLKTTLQKKGFRAQIRLQTSGGRTLSRVLVGPYVDKSMAQRDSAKIANQLKLKPAIMRFKP